MADSVMAYRLTVKEVAHEFGIYATFMPKPVAGVNGSGMHTHQSLFEGDRNAFFDAGDAYHLSPTAKAYIAGLLRYAPEITLVTNQWVNSYKRLVPGFEAPVYVCWARRNRSAPGAGAPVQAGQGGGHPDRVPLAGPGLQPVSGVRGHAGGRPRRDRGGAGAAARGLEQHLRDDRGGAVAAGIASLPEDLHDAIRWRSDSKVLRDALGEHVHEFLIRNKRAEWDSFKSYVSPYELERYLPVL